MYLIHNSNYPTKKMKAAPQYQTISRSYIHLLAKDAIAPAGKLTANAIILNIRQLCISGWGLTSDRHRCCNKWSIASTALPA